MSVVIIFFNVHRNYVLLQTSTCYHAECVKTVELTDDLHENRSCENIVGYASALGCATGVANYCAAAVHSVVQ